MKAAARTVLLGAALGLGSGASVADVVSDWNGRAVTAGYAARQGPAAHTRNLAMVHLAMFEAVNSIAPRYSPYRARLPAEAGASLDAAAATAAHVLLVRMYPDQAAEFDKLLQASLAKAGSDAARASGTRVGEQAAARILADRGEDGSGAPNTYRPYAAPGTYVPTALPVFSSWGAVKPFALRSGDQFRPPPPYPLASSQWAKDYEEVKRMGAKSGSARTAEQTDIGQFWELTGAATFNPLVRHLSGSKGLDVVDNARLFALVAMATADAYIAVFDAKYAYNFWRPITAIRNGDLDGNDATARDAGWEPAIPTPMHPEYPCAHCIVQSSAATVLQILFGDSIPAITMTSTTAPKATRTFNRLSDYVAEVIDARIYGGIHYRTSGVVGAAMGKGIGEHVTKNFLTPQR